VKASDHHELEMGFGHRSVISSASSMDLVCSLADSWASMYLRVHICLGSCGSACLS
jgi:hypothetical protein